MASRAAWQDREMETREPSAHPDAQPDTAHPQRQVLAACNLCEAICGLELTIEDRPEGPKVTSIRGNPDDPLSRGHICPKGVALADIHEDPDRLRHPVKRVGEGPDAQWEEISWDEALDLTADGIARTINEHGRNALGVYFGNPNVHSLGAQTHGVLMLKSFKTRNKFSATSVDQLPHQFVAWQLFGHQLLIPIADIDRTSYFLVFGANPMASNGSLMTVPDFPNRLRELKKRGGRMVVFDPRRTETAKVADEHHFVRPATDAVVLLAMVHVLLEEGLADPPAYVRGIESVRLAVADITPEYAAEASGVPAEEIRRITREFAAADGAAAYGRVGLSTQGFGSLCQWALNLLNILTGNFDREGGMLFPEPAVDIVGKAIVGRGHYDVWRSRVRGVPEFGGEMPVSTLREEIETPGEGQIHAMLTVAGNPVLSTPDGAATRGCVRRPGLHGGRRHLPQRDHPARRRGASADHGAGAGAVRPGLPHAGRAEHRAVHPTGLREGRGRDARLGDLPRDRPAHWGSAEAQEDDGQGAHRAGVAQPQPDDDPLDPAPHRPSYDDASAAGQPGRCRPRPAEADDARAAPDQGQADPPRPRPDRRGPRPVAAHHRRDARAALPDGDSNGDLVLIGRRHQRDNNSWMHNTERLTKGKPRHQLLMHPDDLASHGLTDGAPVHVASRVGKVTTEVRATEDMMRGVVSLPHGYGHQLDGVRLTNASKVAGVSANDLTDPERMDVSGVAALNGVPVTVSPA